MLVVDESGALISFFLIKGLQYDQFSFLFLSLINQLFNFYYFLYPFHFYLLSTMYSPFSTMSDIVEVPAASDEDMLIIFEDESEAPQELFSSGTRDDEVAVQLLSLSVLLRRHLLEARPYS